MFQSRSIRATDNKYNPVWKSIDWLEKFYQEGGREKEEEGEREEYSYFNFQDRVKERIRRIEGIPSPPPSIEASYVRVLARLGYQRPLSLSLSLSLFLSRFLCIVPLRLALLAAYRQYDRCHYTQSSVSDDRLSHRVVLSRKRVESKGAG